MTNVQEIWVCPQPNCDYRINRSVTDLDVEAADQRAIARLSAQHAAQKHGRSVIIPGWEGSIGPFPMQYNDPHVYARNIHSGAGNCVCGQALSESRHVQAAPGVPVPDRMRPMKHWSGLGDFTTYEEVP